ncbi:MAG: DsbA family protein [Candidatus Kuenenbacteria bacterium]
MEKSIKNYPVFLIIFGLVLGVAIFSTFNYFKLARQITGDKTVDSQRSVSFQIRESDHILGNRDSNITLVIFQEFTCPYCEEYMKTLEDFMADYNDKIRIVWRHFPLNFANQTAIASAVASECAADQDKFWEYAHQLYENQDILDSQLYPQLANNLGLDLDQFNQCLQENNYKDKVEAHYNEGLIKGVQGTPTSFLNGRSIPGALPYYDLQQLIDPLTQ